MRKQPPPLPNSPEPSRTTLANVTVVTLTRERKTSSVVRKIAHAIVLPEQDDENATEDPAEDYE